MHEDLYGNAVSTQSAEAAEAYSDGLHRFLTARPGVKEALNKAAELDEGFALAHIALSREHQVMGNRDGVKASLAAAQAAAEGATPREQSHLHAMGLLLSGKVGDAYGAIRAHLNEHPRDAMIAQTCTGVFGLIGFSGKPGREAEQLAFTSHYLPHYADDPWYLGQHAFAQCEVGQNEVGRETIGRSLEGDPGNAHSAHVHAHLDYERGAVDTGYDFLDGWCKDQDATGVLACHISWHLGIWALEMGKTEAMWDAVDKRVNPDNAAGPPINILTDYIAFLFRLHVSGAEVSAERWRGASDYAAKMFPKAGLAFVDVHSALAHMMAGDKDRLAAIIDGARGPAGDIVGEIAKGFAHAGDGNWAKTVDTLGPLLTTHERIGGSRAQRDLLEFAVVHGLKQLGREEEADRLISIRRPHVSHALLTH